MRSALPAVATATLLVLAGCSGVGPTPDLNPSPDAETTTATPEYPPGVTADGLQNPETLVRAHTASVRMRGATVTWNATATILVGGEPRTIEFDSTAWATPNAARIYYDTRDVRLGKNETMRAERVEVYADDDTVHTRHVLDGHVTTVSTDPRPERGGLVSLHVARTPFVQRVLTGGTFEVVNTERRNGVTVTTLTASTEEFTNDGRRAFYATLDVTDDGHILSLSVDQNPDANTAPGRRTANARWTEPPEPEPPAWVR